MLENIFETISVFGKEYNIENINTISGMYSNKEYLYEIDLDNMEYVFRCQNVTYSKSIGFIKDTNALLLQYDIKNENEDRIKFSISPLITYRDHSHMKKASFLKFGSRKIDNGLIVNLSITDNKNLYILYDDVKYTKIEGYMNNVKHEVNTLEEKKDVYIEDLYIPGKFEVYVQGMETKKIRFIISDERINLENITKQNSNFYEENAEYVELNKLKKSIDFLELTNLVSIPGNLKITGFIDNINEKNYMVVLSNMLEIIKSIDGRYISLNELDKAQNKIREFIEAINKLPDYSKNNSLEYRCKFWLVEIIYKLYVKDNSIITKDIQDFICLAMLDIEHVLENKEYEILNNLEMVCLIYNVVKIYEDVLKDPRYTNLALDITETIEKSFWNEDLRVLKQNVDEMETIPRADMIYAICLSYPAVSNSISIKVLDTIFRELYTPYGLRFCKKNKKSEQSLVYPKFMAHFIFANLKQNGNSYSSKKIAYNLVKDLFLDIDKYIHNNVKYVYSEKGIDIDFKALDYYTTCEMIRLYSMFM